MPTAKRKAPAGRSSTPPSTEHRPRQTALALPIALLRAREAVMARFRPLLVDLGLTEQQWRVLRVLEEGGPLEPTDIAERSVILMPSLTRILRTLEADGLIKRSMHPDDGRRALISATKHAQELIKRATPHSNNVYAELEEIYGAARMHDLLAMLDDLTQGAKGMK